MDPSDDRTVPLKTLLRWSEALAGIARTGLGFTESLYEQERFEEILKVAADIRARPTATTTTTDAGGLVQEWMDTVGKGVPGYVTPKVAVGAAVGNDKGELLLIQRADSGIWLYPTGWCDVGYSAAEVVVKEVEEETGIIAEPVRLIAVLDGLRLGFTRVPLYSLLFYCRAVGGSSRRTRSRPATSAGSPATPCRTRWSARSAGASTSSPPSTASGATCSTTACASRCGGAAAPIRRLDGDRPVESVADVGVDDDLVAAVAALVAAALPLARRRRRGERSSRIVADPATTLFVARDDGRESSAC